MASFAPIRGTRSQIQVTPIVDGQFLVETDQGVGNKIYMDEGSTRTIVGGNTVTGVLPQLYIYSETGSTVTVENASGTLIPTSQVGTDHWVCDVPDYGIYTVYSLLDGQTTTQSVNVTDCMIYTIDDSHFHCNVIVTYPSGVGASCQISGGGETYSAPALNPPDTSYKFVVHGKNTTYTITTNVDGAIKTQTVTTGAVLDQTYNVTMPYARINLTVEMPPITGNVTCTDGTTTITKVGTPNMVFYVPNTGTWTISGSDGIDTYDTVVEVNDISIIYNEDLSSAPDGATVTPTDDIQTWLKCAKIKDKTTYSSLDDVLGDNETLQKLISSNNAMNYLVRSKLFAKYVETPVMTGYNTPSGTASASGEHPNTYAWEIYEDLNANNNGWIPPSAVTNCWNEYDFDDAQLMKYVTLRIWSNGTLPTPTITPYITAYDTDTSTWENIGNFGTITLVAKPTSQSPRVWEEYTISLNTDKPYAKYRINFPEIVHNSGAGGSYFKLKYYSADGITNDATAMRLIGEKNYAANILIDDSDWCTNLVKSNYAKLVLNVSVPDMTSNTTPEGTAFAPHAHSNYPAWYVFNGIEKASTSSNRYSPTSTGIFPDTVGYIFTSSHILKAVKILPFYDGSNIALENYTIEGSPDSTDGDNGSWTTLYTGLAQNINGEIIINLPSNITAYKAYRLKGTDAYTNYLSMVTMQFYGREDVDETVYNIYSAADDTITVTPQGGGAAVTITTNNDGYGTIAKSSLPNGIYTFVSSKAENPNNLGASDYYSKTITVFNGMIETCVMPDNMLYWWGWKNDELTCTPSIMTTGQTFVSATFNNVGYAYFASTSTTGSELNSRKRRSGYTNVKSIVSNCSPANVNGLGCVSVLNSSANGFKIDYTYYPATGSTKTLCTTPLNNTLNTNQYILTWTNSYQTATFQLYAFWIE